MLFESKNKSI